jgi:hypothetical protein
MDCRFDRLYILKIGDGEIPLLKQLCVEYEIADNGTFENAADFHKIWGLGPDGLVYLSYGMAQKGFDFNSLEELRIYLDKWPSKCQA